MILLLSVSLWGQKQAVIAQKNFPFTVALQQSADASADEALQWLAEEKFAAVQNAQTPQAATLACKFSEDEMQKAGDRIQALAGRSPFKEIAKALRKSGQYCIYEILPDGEFLKAAWLQDIKAMNRIVDVYAFGAKPRYHRIDSIDLDLEDKEYIEEVQRDVTTTVLAFANKKAFYSVALYSALAWLDVNGRDEAADFEPMAQGINQQAYAAIPGISWNNYPYSAILVLGCGPEKDGEPISPQSRMRAQYAAKLYWDGKAPLIVVSGGRVHPFKTKFSEAYEMKKYLMEDWGVPEQAIVAEPHARHTTTNIRNTVRIFMEQGVPLEKPVLVTSTASHINYVEGEYFQKVCQEQMLQVPFTVGRRLAPRELEILPAACAVQVAPEDPLDP